VIFDVKNPMKVASPLVLPRSLSTIGFEEARASGATPHPDRLPWRPRASARNDPRGRMTATEEGCGRNEDARRPHERKDVGSGIAISRRMWRTLEGNQAHGRIGRSGAGNGPGTLQTRRWSKTLEPTAPPRSRTPRGMTERNVWTPLREKRTSSGSRAGDTRRIACPRDKRRTELPR